MAQLRIGTSGYQYAHWRALLYPKGLAQVKWLAHYASVFSTCELNATFYKLPTESAVDGWRDRTPPGFLFACKGSRYLTHLKRLTDTGLGVQRYFTLIERLGKKLGPVLWQLPPQMNRVDVGRLDAFLACLPRKVRHAVEFRSDAWYTAQVCAVLDRHGAAFCEHDLVDRAPPRFTGGFRYLRFHGASGKYLGRYGKRALRPVARSLLAHRDEGHDVYVYFNNDLRGHALFDALDLLDLVGEAPAREQPLRDAAGQR